MGDWASTLAKSEADVTADIGADPAEATYLYEIVHPRGAAFIYR